MDRNLYEAEHESFRDSVRAFLTKEVVPHFDTWDDAGIVPRELFQKIGELGLFAAVPEEYGGAGVSDFRYNAVYIEESAKAGVSAATLGATLQSDVCMPYLLELTNDEQKARWLPGVASGELIVAIAMTEPGTGSDLSGIRTKAVRDGDDYVIDGAKPRSTDGLGGEGGHPFAWW